MLYKLKMRPLFCNLQNNEGDRRKSPIDLMMEAIEKGDEKTVRELIEKDPDLIWQEGL